MTRYSPLIDPFNRKINYLRVSVTDRCDFRCVYCMSEKMQFLPKKDLLTLEELARGAGSIIFTSKHCLYPSSPFTEKQISYSPGPKLSNVVL